MTILTLIEVRSGDYERIGLGDWICDAQCKPSDASSENGGVSKVLIITPVTLPSSAWAVPSSHAI